MTANAFLVICAQALFIQSTFTACTSRTAVETSGLRSPFGCNPGFTGLSYDVPTAPAWAYDGLVIPGTSCNRGLAYDALFSPAMEFTTGGGAFPVSSSSAMAPIGISIQSDNMYEGALNAAGELPFVGTTGFETMLATVGSGAVNHACENGYNAMSAFSAASSPASVATAGPVFNNGLPSSACGANAFAYDRMMAPGFTTPVMAYNAVPYSDADAVWAGRDIAFDGFTYGSPYEAFEIIPTSGGALPVSSASAMSPTGIAVASDNAYEGALTVGGELPFVGTVAMEGAVPSAGAGAVSYSCGNGRTAMTSEAAGFGSAGAFAPMGAYGAAGPFATNAFAPRFGAETFGYHGIGRGCGCAY